MLDPKTEVALVEFVKALAEKVSKNIGAETKMGLLNGLSGQLLFLASAQRVIPGDVDELTLQEQFDRLHSSLAEQLQDVSLESGLTGIGLTFELLLKIFDQKENINEEIDLLLSKVVAQFTPEHDYELLRGLTGITLYAIERSDHETGANLLQLCIKQLMELKVDLGDKGIAWSTPARSPFRFEKAQEFEFNLGLAHGNFGVLGVLVRAAEKLPSDTLIQTITRHVNWLINQGDWQNEVGCYGYCCNDDQVSRLAWCYGDLTSALALWRAGRLLDNKQILDSAKSMAEMAAKRRMDNSGVVDAGLCHGFAGNAVLFQSLYKAMQSQVLATASQYWFAQLHQALNADMQNFKAAWRYIPKLDTYQEETGLLEGYSGIGLALLSQLGTADEWQTCLLMD